jgi:cell division protein FtsL
MAGAENKMTDWADGIEMRNYGIQRGIDVRMFSDFMRAIIPLAMVAAALVFYSWVRNQMIQAGYESQRLYTMEEALLRAQEKLVLEEETLRNPGRIDAIARNELGMAPLHPSQWIVPQIPEQTSGFSGAIAMADSEAAGLRRSASGRRPNDDSN